MSHLAFIGLGNMSSGMCANLVSSGHPVRAYDLNPEAVDQAVAAGATPALDIASAVAGCDVVITMLPAGKHVHSVYFGDQGVLAHAPRTALLIDCSTISVGEARDAATRVQAAGFDCLDAPVSSGVAAAQAGTLTFMVGGSEAAFERARVTLGSMGKNIFHAGRSGNGQAAKCANNMLLGISMIATCEAFNLAEKLGLESQTFFDIASKASGQCWSMTAYCPAPGPVPSAPSNRQYEPGFAVAMMLKDLRLARDAAAASRAPIPFGLAAHARYQRLAEAGLSAKDFSVVMQQLEGSASPIEEDSA